MSHSPKSPVFFCLFIWLLLAAPFLQAQEISPSTEDAEEQNDASSEAIISEREAVEVVTDSNVAEAISRRPDLQFNNVTIDGERSSLSLDDIPADAVEELEVLRAVTPDMDADSRGGSLNLSSNPTFKQEKPVIKADAYLLFSDKEDTWQQGSSVTYGRALGNLGFRLTASQSNEHDISESIHMDWDQTQEDANVYIPAYLFERFGEYWHINYTLNSNFDYRISDSFYLTARVNLAKYETEGYEPQIRYKYENGTYEQVAATTGRSLHAQVDRDLTGWESHSERYDVQFGGFLDLERFKLDFKVYKEANHYEEPDWTIIEFKTEDIDLDYQLDQDHYPIADQANEMSVTDAASYVFDEYLSERWQNFNDAFITSLNTKYLFEWGKARTYIKAGLKFTSKEKDQRSDSRIYTGYAGDFSLDDIASDYGEESLVIDGLNYGSFPTLVDSRDYLHQHLDHFEYNLLRSAQKGDPATYVVTEDISAAYAMLNVNYGKLRSIVGFRLEQTDLDYTAREIITGESMNYIRTEIRTDKNSYSHLFPAVHLRYFLGKRITLIGAWTMTIMRPWYGDIVPYRFINYDSLEIDEGNPSLKPTIYSNFDFSLDYKLSDASMFSIELFSRDVEDIVFWKVTDIESGPFKGFTTGKNANGPTATERGFRLILSQNLEEWWNQLEGFSVILKGTFQDSETEYPERPGEKMPVTYRPVSVIEATLNYDKGPIYAQISYSHHAKELEGVFENSWEDRYHKSGQYLDLSASYRISDTLRIFLEAENLLGTQYEAYAGSPDRPTTHSWRSTQYQFGFKFNI